jgi:hypothetical protein
VEDDRYDPVINSSVGDLEKFIESIIWQDIRREFQVWADGLVMLYDTLKVSDPEFQTELGRIQGRREAVAYILTLPEVMIEALKEERDDTGRE